MEFLQTLWTTLTTPNEGLIGIIFNNWGIPFVFIELTVFALLFTQILNIKYTKKQLLLYILSFAFVLGLSNTFIDRPYSAYINIIVQLILIILIFKVNFFKAIIAEFIPIIIIAILETIFCKIYIVLFDFVYEELYSIPLIRLSIAILIYSCTYLIYRLIKYYKINIVLLESMNKKNKTILLLNFIFAIITIAVQFYIIGFYLNELPLSISLMSAITLIAYFAISIFSLLKTTKLEATSKSLEEAKLYNRTLQILHDNIRVFRHDFSNIMQSFEGYITNDDMKGLKEYYKGIKNECNNLNNLTALSPSLVNDPALYSLITSKYHLAEQLGITFNINISVKLDEIQTTPYLLTRILGILLDNAIDAAKTSIEKQIYFSVSASSENAKIKKHVIGIENSYSNKDVNLDRIREKGYTSKNTDLDSHGLGLWEVNKILKKSKNLNLYTSKNEKYFNQQLEIFCE